MYVHLMVLSLEFAARIIGTYKKILLTTLMHLVLHSLFLSLFLSAKLIIHIHSLALLFLRTIYTVNVRSLLPVERYSESESQIGNSGSEDNCNFGNSNTISSSNNKETSGKNHTSIQTGYIQNNGTINNSDNASIQFTNGSMSNGNLEHIATTVKECHSNNKDSNKTKSINSAKKNSNKRSRNR